MKDVPTTLGQVKVVSMSLAEDSRGLKGLTKDPDGERDGCLCVNALADLRHTTSLRGPIFSQRRQWRTPNPCQLPHLHRHMAKDCSQLVSTRWPKMTRIESSPSSSTYLYNQAAMCGISPTMTLPLWSIRQPGGSTLLQRQRAGQEFDHCVRRSV
jgi:hypothetical protein